MPSEVRPDVETLQRRCDVALQLAGELTRQLVDLRDELAAVKREQARRAPRVHELPRSRRK
jgi:hypothetical protein